MNFFNVGGGELLVIVLLALLMFGPKDIMNIMRTIGKYTRAASKAWAQIVASLQGEIMPEDVREIVNETQESIGEVRQTFKGIGESMNEIQASVREDVKDLDKPLRVTMPDTLAEVRAEARKTEGKKRAAAQDPGVEEMLALLEKTAPRPTPAKQAAASSASETESAGDSSYDAPTDIAQAATGNSAPEPESTNEATPYGE